MDNIITVRKLKNKYGPIYDLAFTKDYTTKDQDELVMMDLLVKEYFRQNPSKVFLTNNPKVIDEFVDQYDKYITENPEGEFSRKEVQEYMKSKRNWYLRKRGIMSKPILGKILDHSSFIDLLTMYSNKDLRKILFKINFWQRKLEELNREDDILYQAFLEIKSIQDLVLTIMGIKELVNTSDKRVFSLEIDDIEKPSRYVRSIYRSKDLELENVHPKLLANLLPLLRNLRELIINNNRMIEPFGRNSNLQHLTIINSQGEKIFPVGIFSNLKNLSYLQITHSDFEYFPKGSFGGLSNLIILDLSHNKIQHLTKDMFSGLVMLEILILTHNQISSIADNTFEDIDNLREIYLGNNNLTSISPVIFRNLNHLLTLGLRFNKIKTIPDEIYSYADGI